MPMKLAMVVRVMYLELELVVKALRK